MKTKTTEPKLPKGINKTDLKRPKYDAKDPTAKGKDGQEWNWHEYQLWYTERFGWVLPTLLISKGRGGQPDRYYGITVGDGSTYGEKKAGGQVRIGQGPHVKQQLTVYVRQSRLEKLQFIIDLYNQGLESAGDTRDRISTRRARTASRRRSFDW